MRATLLLAIMLFLIGAPAPDSATIAEMTAQFIVLDDANGLQASEADETESGHPSRQERPERTPAGD